MPKLTGNKVELDPDTQTGEQLKGLIISAITGGTSNCTGISCNYHKCPFNKNISDSCDKSVIRNRTTEPTEHQWRVLIKLAIHGEYEL